MPVAQFEYIRCVDGDYVAYFLRDTPTPSFSLWLIPGTWAE
jgi:hypothetical protein